MAQIQTVLYNYFPELHYMKAYKGGKDSGKPSDIDPNLLRVMQQYQQEGQKVVPNETGKKYSAALIDLVKPYHAPTPNIDELEELLELATVAWNLATMKKEFPMVYNTTLQEAKKDLSLDKKSFQLLEKLVKDKEQRFSDYDMIIHDFQVNMDDQGEAFITTMAKPLDSFLLDELAPGKEDDDDEETNFEPGYINRNAFIVKPKQPFIAWLKKTDENALPDEKISEHTIYLISEKANNSQIEKWLKKNFDTVFKKELEAWFTDEKLWPEKRTYKLFQEWFDVEYHSMVYDLEDFPVDKDGE